MPLCIGIDVGFRLGDKSLYFAQVMMYLSLSIMTQMHELNSLQDCKFLPSTCVISTLSSPLWL